mmetsp:Transcript_15874/g.13875  ORF Transcript_15874/g.13875 Transcript_15874/m.13875 type:complete len:189 (+) Transcript_15874:320-886(+)
MFDIIDYKWTDLNAYKISHKYNKKSLKSLSHNKNSKYYNPKLYGHKMLMILDKNRSSQINSINLWSLPEMNKYSKIFQKVTNEGIYSFGGLSQESIKNNTLSIKSDIPKANNDLRFMPIGNGPQGWKVLDVVGRKPVPRYFMSFEHFEHNNMLVVFGGRVHQEVGVDEFGLNDIWLLTLKHLQWFQLN